MFIQINIVKSMSIAILLFIITTQGFAWNETQTLYASDGGNFSHFGYSMSTGNQYLVVGAVYHVAGAVYIFKRNENDTWHEIQKLSPTNAEHWIGFGVSVDIYNDEYIVIGAVYNGIVYVYKRVFNDTWTEIQILNAHTGIVTDVTMYDEYIAVGQPTVNLHTGATYIFKRVNGTYIQWQILNASDAHKSDSFGGSVAMHGTVLVIGASREDTQGNDAGAAYVFELNGTWKETQILYASDATNDDQFGSRVEIYGSCIVVGARGANDNGGAAYVFKRVSSGSLWEEKQKLPTFDVEPDDLFSSSIAMYDRYMVIGARGVSNDTGAAYVYFQNDTNHWEEDIILHASDAQNGDIFGYAVSIWNHSIIVGAAGEDTMGGEAGAVYIFANTTAAPPTKNPTATPSYHPTATPSDIPTASPSYNPTTSPSHNPTASPSNNPTASPSDIPTATPSYNPTTTPSNNPTASPICGDNTNSGPGEEIECKSDADCCIGFSCRTKEGPKKGKCGKDENNQRSKGYMDLLQFDEYENNEDNTSYHHFMEMAMIFVVIINVCNLIICCCCIGIKRKQNIYHNIIDNASDLDDI